MTSLSVGGLVVFDMVALQIGWSRRADAILGCGIYLCKTTFPVLEKNNRKESWAKTFLKYMGIL